MWHALPTGWRPLKGRLTLLPVLILLWQDIAGARCVDRRASRCRSCGTEFRPDPPIVLCPCGSADVAVLGGEELKILSVQVA